MNRRLFFVLSTFACVALALSLSAADVSAANDAFCVGTGLSQNPDPAQAGKEAALIAKSRLGCGEEPVIVIVFDALATNADAKKKMLDAVAETFPAELIYGCSTYSPLNEDDNTGTCGVMAIGGDITVCTAVADLEGGHKACGTRIGESLKADCKCTAPGKLVVLFGSCHVPKDDDLVQGVHEVLGKSVGIAGGAASKGEFVYAKGKLLEEKSNVGVMICGDFALSFASGKGPGREGVISSAASASKKALAEAKGLPLLVLACDCGGRRGSLGDNVSDELDAIKNSIGDRPLFGFYGSGEIGPFDNKSAPVGVGYTVVFCVISTGK